MISPNLYYVNTNTSFVYVYCVKTGDVFDSHLNSQSVIIALSIVTKAKQNHKPAFHCHDVLAVI